MSDVAAQLSESHQPGKNLRRWWIVVTVFLALAVFAQAIFAGAMLSGMDWGLMAHRATATLLIASSLAAALVSVLTLRRITSGSRLVWILLAFTALIFLQAGIGALSAKGVNLMWVHVPLGVLLVGFATQATAAARRLGGET